MNRAELVAAIDHTLLKPDASWSQIAAVCDEAKRFGVASVCVNGARVVDAVAALAGSDVPVAAVVGFPLGAMATEMKAAEAAQVVEDGAREIDMVLNVGWAKDGDWDAVRTDIAAVVAAGGVPVKVILETCLLTDDEKRRACEVSVETGAAFVKTSTGFAGGGATVEDVRLMREVVGDRARVKASGGMRDTAAALAMIEAGADRLGMSATVAVVEGLQ